MNQFPYTADLSDISDDTVRQLCTGSHVFFNCLGTTRRQAGSAVHILRDNTPCCQVDSNCYVWGLFCEILVKFIITMVMLKKHDNIIINITGIVTPQPDSFQTIFMSIIQFLLGWRGQYIYLQLSALSNHII